MSGFSKLLADALRKRLREWGASNARTLAALRAGTLPTRRFPTRPQQSIGDGAYLTHIGAR